LLAGDISGMEFRRSAGMSQIMWNRVTYCSLCW